MKSEIAKLWIEDLRTTDAPQAKKILFNGTGYCCLGRLCVVLGYNFTDENKTDKQIININHYTVLPDEVRILAGMKTCNGSYGSPCFICR